MIGLVDYGAGNLGSVAHALEFLALPFTVCREPGDLDAVERVLLPGVGHFGPAAERLEASGLARELRARAARGLPLLGVCLGLQLLLEGSDEAPGRAGLALLAGRCVPLRARRVPHMGWNLVAWTGAGLAPAGHYYFAHSFVAAPASAGDVCATCRLEGREIPAAVRRGSVWGLQFHPEKSGDLGLECLRSFARC